MKKNSKTNKASVNLTPSSVGVAKRDALIVSTAPESSPPESTAGRRVWLEFLNPEAKSVYVAGSFNGWKPDEMPLRAAGNGRWIGELKVNPGRHEYLFVVDGNWTPDPTARDFAPNPFGGKNSVVQV